MDSPNPLPSAKKRKRSRRLESDRKFECHYQDCGKSYSRAEHLYRHQLNHSPKLIYRCDFPGCHRSFVRHDLCVRHRERHTTKGSQLQKRDSFTIRASSQAANGAAAAAAAAAAVVTSSHPLSPPASAASASSLSLSASVGSGFDATPASRLVDGASRRRSIAEAAPSTFLSSIPTCSTLIHSNNENPSTSLVPQSHSTQQSSPESQSYRPLTATAPSASSAGGAGHSYGPPQHGMNLSAPGYPHLSMAGEVSPSLDTSPSMSALPESLSGVPGEMVSASTVAGSAFDPLSICAYPIFGGEIYNRSPFAMADDFAAWLFNEPMLSSTAPTSSAAAVSSSLNYPPSSGMLSNFLDPMQSQNRLFMSEPPYSSFFTHVVPQHPMSVTSILDPGSPQALVSEDKRQELLHLMATRFNEAAHSTATAKRKDALMDGNLDDDHHVLSLRMMQVYIGSYWNNFHSQLPILHQPTFSADRTPNLLLLSVMAIGASTLDKNHGREIIDRAAELASFIAWHLRWEIFMDADFRPPAKLWVFQALLLLEVYEKMYSTRALHERAHIHHDTTLTLMRRGSSLIGRSSCDSPGSLQEAQSTSTLTLEFAATAVDESWSHWIKAEATRRVAFAAFVIDSTHATMFGHSAKMVAHELRLPLPCDEALWAATSAAEVARVQSSLQTNGVKPIMFLDGLKKTLNGQRVRTNAFGRTILMAGLLSVNWHMNQRDLQVNSLGVSQSLLGSRDKWRTALLRAFDNWRRDFDEALAQTTSTAATAATGLAMYSSTMLSRSHAALEEEASIFESRDVLYGLAHMASHVDIVDCQIYAGAGRLMGRFVTPKDYSTAREKLTERWATKASAREATFHALKFLSECLLQRNGGSSSTTTTTTTTSHVQSQMSSTSSPATAPTLADEHGHMYCVRDDNLLNRPWVLYFAALVVWCYGFALDGPIKHPPMLITAADQRHDMQQFLRRVGGVRVPDDLTTMTGRNQCLGLLMALRDGFLHTRWELLVEAGRLLDSCIEKLRGGGGAT